MTKKQEHELVKRALVRGIRMRVRYELANMQDRLLNEVETAAVEEFDAAVVSGEDFSAVAARLLDSTLDVRAALR